MSQRLLILLILVGAALAAPLKVVYVLEPAVLKQDAKNPTKIVAVISPEAPLMVMKFEKPILPEISLNPAFKKPEINRESSILKLELTGALKKPTVLDVTDKKTGDTIKIMVVPEGGKIDV